VALPAINSQSISQTIIYGSNTTLTVTAIGGGPLVYQWCQNGQALSGATNSTLALQTVTRGSAGTYTVTVTNMVGSVTSTNINIRVLVPQVLGTPTVVNGGEAQFAFQDVNGSVAALSYTSNFVVQTSTNLASPIQWLQTPGNFSSSNNFLIFQEASPTNLPARFFRITEQ